MWKWKFTGQCEKGEDIAGGAKYTFTVNVDEKISKGSYMAIMKEFKRTARFPGDLHAQDLNLMC